MTTIQLKIEVSKEASNITQLMVEGKNLPPSFNFDGTKWQKKFETYQLDDDGDLDVFLLFTGIPRRKVMVKLIINNSKTEEASEVINDNGYGFVRMFDIKPQ